MIGVVDLLPASSREAFIRRRRRRRWIGVYTVALVVLAGAHFGVSFRQSGIVETRDELRAQVQQRLYQNEEATTLIAQVRDLEQRLTHYNDLAWPIRMSEVMDSVGTLVPEQVTLTALTLAPRTQRRRIAATTDSPATEQIERMLVVELQGIAVDDVTVAHIVSGLDQHPLFASVVLDFTRERDVDGVDAREFRVNALIDLDVRYEFSDAVAEVLP